MRRRSQTIEADSYEEFLRLSQVPIIGCRHRARKAAPESFLLSQTLLRRSSHLPQKLANIRKKSKEFNKMASSMANHWDDIDFDSQTTSTATISTKSIISAHQGPMDTEFQAGEVEDQMRAEQSVNQVKVMVIGAKGVGRHTFVNTLFGSNGGEQDHSIRTTLDLVVKKNETENSVNIFKFWIKDASSQEFEHLVNAYYKTIELYIFIYQTDDRKSFECLGQAIKKAQDQAKGGRFIGLLIGGASNVLNGFQREVQYQEGEELREKFGLCNFLEMNFVHGEDQAGLLRALTRHGLNICN